MPGCLYLRGWKASLSRQAFICGGFQVSFSCYYQNIVCSSISLRVSNAIISSAYIIGWSFLFTSDFQCAVAAANRISGVLRRQPRINCSTEDGLTLNANIGNIAMKDVEFSYPNRKEKLLDVKCFNRNHFTLQAKWKGSQQIDFVSEARGEGWSGGGEWQWEVHCDQCNIYS